MTNPTPDVEPATCDLTEDPEQHIGAPADEPDVDAVLAMHEDDLPEAGA